MSSGGRLVDDLGYHATQNETRPVADPLGMTPERAHELLEPLGRHWVGPRRTCQLDQP